MSTAADIVSGILEHVKQGNVSKIHQLLTQLPLISLSREHSDMLLACFLKQAAQVKGIESVREIITVFDVTRARVDPLPALTNLFLNSYLERDTLAFILDCYPHKTELDYYVDLINMGDDQAAVRAAALLATFFTNISHEDWDRLYHLTDNVENEEYENQLLRTYFQTKLAESGECVPRPPWIKDNIKEEELQPVPKDIVPVKDAADFLVSEHKFINELNVFLSEKRGIDLRELLITQYAIATIPEKIKMVEKMKNIPVFDDTNIFHEFGPVNTIYTDDPSTIDTDDICGKYGGCRMLTCTEFECINEYGDDVDIMCDEPFIADWFRGSCDVCLRKIAKRHYAVREPLLYGGWQGCYCSFKCIDVMLKKRQSTNERINLMLDTVAAQLHTYGIRDR